MAAGRPEPPLRIYEIGGGTGTLALNILVSALRPAFTLRMSYGYDNSHVVALPGA